MSWEALRVRWTVIAMLGATLWRKGLPRAAAFVVAVELLGTGLNNLVKIAVDRLRPVCRTLSPPHPGRRSLAATR